MVICKSVINGHICEEPFNVLFEETLDLTVVKLRVYEDSAHIGLDNIR